MLSTLFKAKPIIDEESKAWIFDTFAWCINQLDGDFFKKNSELILPNNTFYSGSSTSVEEMAKNIFVNTTKYTGMTAWPIRLVSAENFSQKPMPRLSFGSALRGENCKVNCQSNYEQGNEKIPPEIDIAFNSSQLNQPQDLIAYLVQIQASILVKQNDALPYATSPPGGQAVLAQTIDLVACFMGFGVIFANTAYQFKGGCGSCNNPNANRQSALPENETIHALALFCLLKCIKPNAVKPHLKSHLRKQFSLSYNALSNSLKNSADPVLFSLL